MTPKEGIEKMDRLLSGYTGQNPMLWVILSANLEVKFGMHDSCNMLGLRMKYDNGSIKSETLRWEQVEDFGRLSKEQATSLLNIIEKPPEIYSLLRLTSMR